MTRRSSSAGNGMKQERIYVLVVDQEANQRELMARLLEAWDFEVLPVSSSAEALNLARRQGASIAVVTTPGGGRDGIELLRALRAACPGLETVLLSGDGSAPLAEEAFRAGAYDCMKLPVDFKQLSRALNTMRESVQRNRERQVWEEAAGAGVVGLGSMVGISAPMQAVFGSIQRLAAEQAAVLITGLIGTGKELVARALHDLSPRAREAMVVYRCCGVSEELAAGELFGPSAESSNNRTGARELARASSAQGVLHSSQGGTLLLDEIADLYPSIQSRLVEALRAGGTGHGLQKPVPALLLATTRLNLADRAGRGQFNGDLFRLVSPNVIHLPSLAERREDIPLLCRHFQEKFNQEFGKKTCGYSPAAEHALLNYHWPGNVRELKNVIGRACLLAAQDWIELSDLFIGNLSSGNGWGESRTGRAAEASALGRDIDSTKEFKRLPRVSQIVPKSGT